MQPCLLQALSMWSQKVSKPDRYQWGGLEGPPLGLKYLIFMENFQKNQETLINDLIKLTNQIPLCKFEPPIKTSWIRPCV